jgi:predicted type IV restriction endonuclease
MALSSKSSSKALKARVIDSEEDASEGAPEHTSEDDEEMVLMARRVSQWAKRSKCWDKNGLTIILLILMITRY